MKDQVRKTLLEAITIPDEVRCSASFIQKAKNVRRTRAPYSHSSTWSTKIAHSASLSPSKPRKMTADCNDLPKASKIYDSPSLSIISSVSGNSHSSEESVSPSIGIQLRMEERKVSEQVQLKNMPKLEVEKVRIEDTKPRTALFLLKNQEEEKERVKDSAEKYLKGLGESLFQLRIESPAKTYNPSVSSLSPARKARKPKKVKKNRRMSRKGTRKDMSNLNWKQLSMNLIELEKELEQKYEIDQLDELVDLPKGGNESKESDNSSVSSDEAKDEIFIGYHNITITGAGKGSPPKDKVGKKDAFKIRLMPLNEDEDKEVKMYKSDKELVHLNQEDEEEECADSLQVSKLAFKKRARISSNVDCVPGKKNFSPLKSKACKAKRRDSISDSEFNAFYSAFEMHSKVLSGQASNALSLPSSEAEGSSTQITANSTVSSKVKAKGGKRRARRQTIVAKQGFVINEGQTSAQNHQKDRKQSVMLTANNLPNLSKDMP